MAKVKLPVFVVLLALVWGLPVAADQRADNAPIKIESCYAIAFGHGDERSTLSGIDVRFKNMTNTTLHEIVWRASTPAGTVDLTATGVFSPGASIRKELERRGSGFHGPMHSTMEVVGPGVCTAMEFRDANGNVTNEPAPAPVPFYVPPVPADNATPVPASIDSPSGDAVGVVSCAFSIVRGRAYGHVRFRNLSSANRRDPLSRVLWIGRNRLRKDWSIRAGGSRRYGRYEQKRPSARRVQRIRHARCAHELHGGRSALCGWRELDQPRGRPDGTAIP